MKLGCSSFHFSQLKGGCQQSQMPSESGQTVTSEFNNLYTTRQRSVSFQKAAVKTEGDDFKKIFR